MVQECGSIGNGHKSACFCSSEKKNLAIENERAKVKVLVPYDVLFQLMELHAKVSDW